MEQVKNCNHFAHTESVLIDTIRATDTKEMENACVSCENARALQCKSVFPLMSSTNSLSCCLPFKNSVFKRDDILFCPIISLIRDKMLRFAGIKDPLYAHLLLFCWLTVNLQTGLQVIIWWTACKPASSSLLLPILSTCLVFPHMPGTDLAGSIITSVGFVCHGYYTKKCWSDFCWGVRGWGRRQGKNEPMILLELEVNKRWCVKIFWVSLYILK